MASIGHVAIALAAGRLLSRSSSQPPSARSSPPGRRPPVVLGMAILTVLSIAPDVDILAFRLGIPYWAPFGHRGATHSIVFALVLGALAAGLTYRYLGALLLQTALFCVFTVLTHPLLDAMTDGGLGVALEWPLSNARYFAPIRFIPVAPIGTRFLSGRGLMVAVTELLYFAPLLAYALWPRSTRRAPAASIGVDKSESVERS